MSPVIGMLIGIAAIRRWPWSWPRMMPISWIIAWRSATIRFDHSNTRRPSSVNPWKRR